MQLVQENSTVREKLGEIGNSQAFLAMLRSLVKQYDSELPRNALKLRDLLKPDIVFRT